MIDLDGVAFFSGNEIDKIVDVKSGSYVNGVDTTTRSGGISDLEVFAIPHSFGRPVFTDALIRLPGLGTPWLSPGSRDIDFITYSTATHMCIAIASSVSITVDYTLIASWITDYDTSNPLVPEFHPTEKDILFDSRVNYQKIAVSGAAQGVATPGVTTHNISHPTGKESNFKVYFEALPDEVWLMNAGGIQNPFVFDFAQCEADAVISTTQLSIDLYGYSSSDPNTRAWYRVYFDD